MIQFNFDLIVYSCCHMHMNIQGWKHCDNVSDYDVYYSKWRNIKNSPRLISIKFSCHKKP